MDLWNLKPGDRVHTVEGMVAEILSGTEDGKWIRVRYLESQVNPLIAGTEDLCHVDELRAKIPQTTVRPV